VLILFDLLQPYSAFHFDGDDFLLRIVGGQSRL